MIEITTDVFSVPEIIIILTVIYGVIAFFAWRFRRKWGGKE
jgi:heme/copper-type cytochrome/quinol oxidase subunit 2